MSETISIHTPLTGSDPCAGRCPRLCSRISIHTPLTGSDSSGNTPPVCSSIFQSTLPSRGVTSIVSDLNTAVLISIHTPLTGSDIYATQQYDGVDRFQSTLPSRGVTAIPHSIMQIFTHVHGGIAQIISFLHPPSFLPTSSARKFPVRTHWQYPVHLWFALHRISGSSTLISRFTP